MNETPQSKAFRETLPEDLRNIAQVSFSYQKLLQITNSHLKTIYGKRADLTKCLDAYFASSEYRENCHFVKRCPDLPLIGKDDIEDMLYEEEKYSAQVNMLLRCHQEISSASLHVNKYNYIYQVASILGVLPDQNNDSLYRWIIQKDGITQQEQKQLYQRIRENGNIFSLITDVLTKMFTPGYLLEFPHVGCVMTQQKGKYYYRGENAFYRSSKASLYRAARDYRRPAAFNRLVDLLRLYECCNFLDQFDAVKYWHYSSINYMALAQHYGFRTQMIDITSDLKTALFFACCRYGLDHKWHPLCQDEIAHRSSRRHISMMGGDSKYGVLYRTPTEITDLNWAISDESAGFQIITPIGYQPFMRCSHQHGYMMLTNGDTYNLMEDPLFDKYKFRLDEELCTWIYEEMDHGNAIYPYDDIPDISQYIEKLNHQCSFSESVFQTTMEGLRFTKGDMGYVRETLAYYGFTIQEHLKFIEAEQLAQINDQYKADYAMQKTGISPQIRPLMTLPSDTIVDVV